MQPIELMRSLLTRTQLTQQSCEVRLALVDWLHRRLRRKRLRTGERQPYPAHFNSLLRRYQLQVAVLRNSLKHQLNELSETFGSGYSCTSVGKSSGT